MSYSPSHLLFIFGRLQPHGSSLYLEYIKGTGPLMKKHQVEVLSVGNGELNAARSGVEQWSINAILGFPTLQSYFSFFEDPAYQKLKEQYRDPAYDVLHLYLIELDHHQFDGERLVHEDLKMRTELSLVLHQDRKAQGWLSGQGLDTPFVSHELSQQFNRLSLFDDLSVLYLSGSHRIYTYTQRPPRTFD